MKRKVFLFFLSTIVQYLNRTNRFKALAIEKNWKDNTARKSKSVEVELNGVSRAQILPS